MQMNVQILMEDTCGNTECVYEHGLSVYIETRKHKILVDTGATQAFLKNAQQMGISLAEVDTVVISHGHYDHAGGVLDFCKLNSKAKIYMQRAAGEDYYHGERYIGIDKRILDLPQLCLLEGDYRMDEELFLFTGITGRRSFPQSNLSLSKKNGDVLEQDSFAHEQCLVVTQGENHILFSGCAHNGILNILDRYQQMFAKEPAAVVSGFHMMKKGEYTSEEEQVICATARELAKKRTIFYTGHCTSQAAIDLMQPIMGEKLHSIHCGKTLF